jgi:hypothetical protein
MWANYNIILKAKTIPKYNTSGLLTCLYDHLGEFVEGLVKTDIAKNP